MTRNFLAIAALAAMSPAFMAEGVSGEGAAPEPNANPALVPLTDEAKVTQLKKNMRSREVFPTIGAAIEKLTNVLKSTDNAYGLSIAITGLDNETQKVDESVYDGMQAVLAYVGTKGDTKTGKESGVKGIVIFPMPTLEAFMSGDAGKAWIGKTIEKESALVAFRNFRDAATVNEFTAGVGKTPKTVDEYVAEHARSGAGLDTETFDIVWPMFRNVIKAKQPALAKALPAKPEVIKAIRSSAYAAAEYPKLEEAGVFAKIIQSCINAAATNLNDAGEAAPLDSTAMQSWLDGRTALVLTKAQARDVDYDAAVNAFKDWAQ